MTGLTKDFDVSVVEEKFSKKLEETAGKPQHRGAYYQEDATEKGLALVEAKFKDLKLYWLVDVKEDRVYSAKFFTYGGKVSLAIGDTLCAMVKGLTVQEACSLLGSDVENQLRDDSEVPAVPESRKEAFGAVDELLKTIEKEYPTAKALALASSAVKDNAEAPSFTDLSIAEQAWLGLSQEEQVIQIEMVLDEQIRPALNSDGGNVEIADLIDGKKLIIRYQGACGSCGSSIGSTLSFIEQILRKNVYNDLIVVPENYM
ncbi:MAG: NifU family protein [Nitrospinales bacterium]